MKWMTVKRKAAFSPVRSFSFRIIDLFTANRFRRLKVEKEVRRVIEALALCNNVTPTYEGEDGEEGIVYQVCLELSDLLLTRHVRLLLRMR